MVRGKVQKTLLNGRYHIEEDGRILSYETFYWDEFMSWGEPTYEMKPSLDADGYPKITLSYNGEKFTYKMHRLMAETFIPNPENKPQVNHKSGNKLDYSLPNLEWVTASENMQHAYKNGLISKEKISKAVVDHCSSKVYASAAEAAEDLGITYATLKNYLNGNRKNKTCLSYIDDVQKN